MKRKPIYSLEQRKDYSFWTKEPIKPLSSLIKASKTGQKSAYLSTNNPGSGLAPRRLYTCIIRMSAYKNLSTTTQRIRHPFPEERSTPFSKIRMGIFGSAFGLADFTDLMKKAVVL